MADKKDACSGVYRSAMHQIIAKLKKEHRRKGPTLSTPTEAHTTKEGADKLHRALKAIHASTDQATCVELLRQMGVDDPVAKQIVQQSFAKRQQQS